MTCHIIASLLLMTALHHILPFTQVLKTCCQGKNDYGCSLFGFCNRRNRGYVSHRLLCLFRKNTGDDWQVLQYAAQSTIGEMQVCQLSPPSCLFCLIGMDKSYTGIWKSIGDMFCSCTCISSSAMTGSSGICNHTILSQCHGMQNPVCHGNSVSLSLNTNKLTCWGLYLILC